MNRKETSNRKDPRNQNHEARKMNSLENLNKKEKKNIPWWVELLFVQIGLPDKLLIKILKTKKNIKEFIKNDKKSLITVFFIVTTISYFYPVIKHAKNKLDCESIAKNYKDRILTIGRVAHITEGTKPGLGRVSCQYRNRCRRGCPYGAYFSSNSSTLPAAELTGNMTLRPNSVVYEVIYDPNKQRATGVHIRLRRRRMSSLVRT